MPVAPDAAERAADWLAFHPAAVVAVLALLLAIVASVADSRRSKRTGLDRVGFMPWRGIMVMAMFVAFGAAFYAMKGE